MGGDGSFRRGQESEKQRMFPAANVLEKNPCPGKTRRSQRLKCVFQAYYALPESDKAIKKALKE